MALHWFVRLSYRRNWSLACWQNGKFSAENWICKRQTESTRFDGISLYLPLMKWCRLRWKLRPIEWHRDRYRRLAVLASIVELFRNGKPRAWRSLCAIAGRMHCGNRCNWWVTVGWAVADGSCSNACSPNGTEKRHKTKCEIIDAINLMKGFQFILYFISFFLGDFTVFADLQFATHSS